MPFASQNCPRNFSLMLNQSFSATILLVYVPQFTNFMLISCLHNIFPSKKQLHGVCRRTPLVQVGYLGQLAQLSGVSASIIIRMLWSLYMFDGYLQAGNHCNDFIHAQIPNLDCDCRSRHVSQPAGTLIPAS